MHLLSFIQGNAPEGPYIALILILIIGIGVIVTSLNDSAEKNIIKDKFNYDKKKWEDYQKELNQRLANSDKVKYEKLMFEKKITWTDYHSLYQLKKFDLANEVYAFLKQQEEEMLKIDAKEFELNSKINLSDIRLGEKLKNLGQTTCRCNKCNNDLMRIWRLGNNIIELRCEDCKKKFMYEDLFLENSEGKSKINFDETLDDISSFYDRIEAENKNPYIRKTELKLDYTGHKSNSPFTYPVTLTPLLKAEVFKSTKTKTTIDEKRSRRISQEVKDLVWNRDGGKCVECGSNENLEFDHIIPHSKGGANTYRNIQLLCERCNRSKSDRIGL